MTTRQLTRKKLLLQRAKITLPEQKIASAIITEQLSKLPIFSQCQTIASYIAIQHEIDPSQLIKKAWQNNKSCYLPVLQEKQLIFCVYEQYSQLKKNRFNIPEPSLGTCINPKQLDLVLVPLVGFNGKGQRLGMGAGFYDRSFNFLLNLPRAARPFLLGLAYEWQKLESFAAEKWDVPLNAVITEKKIYFCNSN